MLVTRGELRELRAASAPAFASVVVFSHAPPRRGPRSLRATGQDHLCCRLLRSAVLGSLANSNLVAARDRCRSSMGAFVKAGIGTAFNRRRRPSHGPLDGIPRYLIVYDEVGPESLFWHFRPIFRWGVAFMHNIPAPQIGIRHSTSRAGRVLARVRNRTSRSVYLCDIARGADTNRRQAAPCDTPLGERRRAGVENRPNSDVHRHHAADRARDAVVRSALRVRVSSRRGSRETSFERCVRVAEGDLLDPVPAAKDAGTHLPSARFRRSAPRCNSRKCPPPIPAMA
jgi:hypothetical protein